MSGPINEEWHYPAVRARAGMGVVVPGAEPALAQSGRQGNEMNRHPALAPRLSAPVLPGGRWVVHGYGRPKIRVGAVMWIAGPVLYLIAQLVAQAAWRTPYSWAVNPLSDLGAVRCQRMGSGYPLPRYVCSPLHGVVNTSVIAVGILLAGGVLLTACCWGSGIASRGARSLLTVAAAGLVMVGLVPEDVNPGLHLLGAFLAIVVGNCGFMLGRADQAEQSARQATAGDAAAEHPGGDRGRVVVHGPHSGRRFRRHGTACRLPAPLLDGYRRDLPATRSRPEREASPASRTLRSWTITRRSRDN